MSYPRVTEHQVYVQSCRSSPDLDFCILNGKELMTSGEEKKEEEEKILDSFGGLILDCNITVSGVQSVIAECSLYICVDYIPQEKNQ